MGYELRLAGENEEFARYSGVSIVKVIVLSQILGGFVAGLGGGVEMLSPIYSRFTWTSLLGYGWDAIIICTLAKKNPDVYKRQPPHSSPENHCWFQDILYTDN